MIYQNVRRGIRCFMPSRLFVKRILKREREQFSDLSRLVLLQEKRYDDKEIFDFIRKYGVHSMVNANWVWEYWNSKLKVYYDKHKELPYVMHKKNRLYFKRGMQKEQIILAYMYLCIEQDKRSPHCYRNMVGTDRNYDVIIDVGGAEGIFALDYIDNAKKIIIIEADFNWQEALKATFEPYKDKVTILSKYISDKNDEMNITLDQIIECHVKKDSNCLIKMDIEGYEERALYGAKKSVAAQKIHWVIALYHKISDEWKLPSFFEKTRCQISSGYVIPRGEEFCCEPYLRKGILYVD